MSILAKYKYQIFFAILIIFIASLWVTSKKADERYRELLSVTILDRNGIPLSLKENLKGHYVYTVNTLPEDFKYLLIEKEDKYFNYHFGINPISTIRAVFLHVTNDYTGGASTITQQLSKNLLKNELDRNILNKIYEAFYAISIELFNSKEDILVMYANTVYLGNQVQGFETGSYAYFNKSLRDTSHSEKISLLATLSYPNTRNPWEESNSEFSSSLNKRISPDKTFTRPITTNGYSFQNNSYFEIKSLGVVCNDSCHTTIDNSLNSKIREILKRHVDSNWDNGARNGAVVIIDAHSSEILALVGSKDPTNLSNGDQINMAIQPRPIGSTIKPFIYLKGFTEGLRPYTLVDDREYKYSIATGFPLYPKNYDGQYHGEVTLHKALSNSLNVPSVKILEYIGLQNFYAFLSQKLKFEPIQSYESYQYGIALGGLEMDLLTLTHYFTIFPKMGIIEPIRILTNSAENFSLPPQANISNKQVVSDEKFVQLVHAVISDRLTGVDQFGLESNLNIETEDYGVKTGTSRDFHDSWVVGYTGDFVVGVWIGNTENEALKQVTGQSGAGAIWHDTMNLLLESPYNKHTKLSKNNLSLFSIDNSTEWGLNNDIIDEHQKLLLDDSIILSPYNNDSFEFTKNISIPLKSSTDVTWSVNGQELGVGKVVNFKPSSQGNYEIMATKLQTNEREIIQVQIINPE